MRISDWSSDVCSSDLLERRVIGEGAMFDAVDARRGRGGDAARAVGVRHDLEAERMGGVGDALEFGAGEMAFEPARLLRQSAAGRGDLYDVGAGARRLADLFGAFDRSGAGVPRAETVLHLPAQAGSVPVAADDRHRRAGDDAPERHG